MAEINPVMLIPDKNVSIQITDDMSRGLALVEKHANDRYVIYISSPLCRQVYNKSWLKGKIDFDEFLIGFLIHEVAHIKYDTFPMPSSKIHHYIDNVLEDSRIEYHMSFDHPAYAKYINWLLSAMKDSVEIDDNAVMYDITKKHVSKVESLLSQLYRIVRFGVVEDDFDQEFVNLVLPLALSSKRGSRDNCRIASKTVFDYIAACIGGHSNMDFIDAAVDIIVTSFDKKDANDIANSKSMVNTNAKQIIVDAVGDGGTQSNDSFGDMGAGKLAGSGADKLVLNENETGFYRATVQKHGNMINKIRRSFANVFKETRMVQSFDGEFNINKQQEAYLSSLVGEHGKTYFRREKSDLDIDLVLARDVSASTSRESVVYAESLVCVLAAVEPFKDVRTAVINFSSDAQLTKSFDEPVKQSLIYPYSHGGTNLMPAINIIKNKLQWKSRSRLIAVITDGEIFDLQRAMAEINKMKQDEGVKFVMIDVSGRGVHQNAIRCEFGELNKVISDILMKELGVRDGR